MEFVNAKLNHLHTRENTQTTVEGGQMALT